MKNVKNVTQLGAYGPHTYVKCLLKALIFGNCKNNILMYEFRDRPQ